MRTRRAALALALLFTLHGVGSARSTPVQDDRRVPELEGVFVVGPVITGAALVDGYLYVTTTDRLSIYDTRDPLKPTLVGWAVSPNGIYGELISTDGDTLLLNDYGVAGVVEVWNVEDKTNPTLVEAIPGVGDEHVSCLLRCTWAYGSNGTILELGSERPIRSENWLEITGDTRPTHRIDEFRHGFMASAPRGAPPQVIDVRDPLRPRVIATARVPSVPPSSFLFSTWARRGDDRFFITSGEMGECREDFRGAFTTFDTSRWPERRAFRMADTYRYKGETESDDEGCSSYYFSLHPDFRDGGLAVLPSGFEGVRVLQIDDDGTISEEGSFTTLVSDVWLAFWVDEEVFYALNTTGEVYILSYRSP